MSENTTDEEPEVEAENAGSSGSGLKTLALLGISFIAGYIVGKSQSESGLGEELEELGESGSGPMEIEIHDTDAGATTESAEENGESEESEVAEESEENQGSEPTDEEGEEEETAESGDEEEEEEEEEE
jgi:hypothetical protein